MTQITREGARVRYCAQYLRSLKGASKGVDNSRGTVRFVNRFRDCPATAIVLWDDGHVSTVPVTDLVSEDRELEAA